MTPIGLRPIVVTGCYDWKDSRFWPLCIQAPTQHATALQQGWESLVQRFQVYLQEGYAGIQIIITVATYTAIYRGRSQLQGRWSTNQVPNLSLLMAMGTIPQTTGYESSSMFVFSQYLKRPKVIIQKHFKCQQFFYRPFEKKTRCIINQLNRKKCFAFLLKNKCADTTVLQS